jgi:hypothetical protein
MNGNSASSRRLHPPRGAALLRRDVAEPAATIAAEAGVGAFKVGFERWVDDPRRRKTR